MALFEFGLGAILGPQHILLGKLATAIEKQHLIIVFMIMLDRAGNQKKKKNKAFRWEKSIGKYTQN